VINLLYIIKISLFKTNMMRLRTKITLWRHYRVPGTRLFCHKMNLWVKLTCMPYIRSKAGAHVKWNCNKTEIKLKQNFRWRSTKMFCFSFISAARTCETKRWNELKSGRGLSSRPCRWQQSGAGGHATVCLPGRGLKSLRAYSAYIIEGTQA